MKGVFRALACVLYFARSSLQQAANGVVGRDGDLYFDSSASDGEEYFDAPESPLGSGDEPEAESSGKSLGGDMAAAIASALDTVYALPPASLPFTWTHKWRFPNANYISVYELNHERVHMKRGFAEAPYTDAFLKEHGFEFASKYFYHRPSRTKRSLPHQGWKMHYQPPAHHFLQIAAALIERMSTDMDFKMVKKEMAQITYTVPPLAGGEGSNLYGKYFTFYTKDLFGHVMDIVFDLEKTFNSTLSMFDLSLDMLETPMHSDVAVMKAKVMSSGKRYRQMPGVHPPYDCVFAEDIGISFRYGRIIKSKDWPWKSSKKYPEGRLLVVAQGQSTKVPITLSRKYFYKTDLELRPTSDASRKYMLKHRVCTCKPDWVKWGPLGNHYILCPEKGTLWQALLKKKN